MFFKQISPIIIIAFFYQGLMAQSRVLTEKQAIDLALSLNPQIQIAALKVDKQKRLKTSAYTLDNIEVILQAPQGTDYRPSILQRINFPTVYTSQSRLQKINVKLAESEQKIVSNNLIYAVRTSFNNLNYLIEKYKTLKFQDSIFSDIININEIRYRVGQISNLEKINGEAYYKQIHFNLLQTYASLQNEKIQLAILIGTPEDTTITTEGKLTKISDYEVNLIPDTTFETNPLTTFYEQNIKASKGLLQLERNKRLPGFVFGYFQQDLQTNPRYNLQVGLTLPIWYWSYGAKIAASKKEVEISYSQSRLNNYQLKGEYSKELAQFRQYKTAVEYFETVGNIQANEILKAAKESYRLGSISYYFYLQNLNQAFQIQLNSLEALKNYNQSIITLQFLLGNTNI
jgi:outer membrane protein TolC